MSDEAKMLLAELCIANVDRNATNDANVRLRARIAELEEALRDVIAERHQPYYEQVLRNARAVLEKGTRT